VLADLPIDLDRKHDITVTEERGASWWYLTCECDDFYVNVVEEVVSLCTLAQIRTICSVKGASGESLLERSTPSCQSVLQAANRFVGRFEFDENNPVFTENAQGLRVFDAQDFGDIDDADAEGRRVVLKCFAKKEFFEREVRLCASVVVLLKPGLYVVSDTVHTIL
jgi:hypothetical protein